MKELWLDRRKTRLILLSSLFFLLAAHLYRWVNTMYSHDSLLIIQDDWVWQISLGRIFNPLYVRLRGNILAPMNVALFSSAFLILSAALVVRILRLEKTASIIMCCGFLITFETIAYVNGMFLHSLDLDMLELLREVLEGGDPKKLFFKGLRCSGMLILGCIDENPSAAVDERFEIVGDGMRHRFAVSYLSDLRSFLPLYSGVFRQSGAAP